MVTNNDKNIVKDLSFEFKIQKNQVQRPAPDNTVFTYNSLEQTYEIAENPLYTISGNKRTESGKQKVRVSLVDTINYEWDDGTTDDLVFDFVVAKQKVVKPSSDDTVFIYNNKQQTYTVDKNLIYTVTGNKRTETGSQEVTVSLIDTINYEWADRDEKDITVTMHSALNEIASSGYAADKSSADTKVNLSGLVLDNPVIPASGTFGYGYEYAELYDINILGSFSFKGTTLEPRFGNPTPRIAECPGGMINSVGLQNPGVDKVISEELPKLRECFNKKVIANIGGYAVEEFVQIVEKLDKEDVVGIHEVNISCPNLHKGGKNFGIDANAAYEVTKAVKAAATKPVYVKLTPNVTDIVSIAKAVEEAGADGISMINTLLGMRINLRNRKPIIANKMGGFSGSAIFPVALRMVYQVYEAVKIPIIGMGGVSSAEDVIEMMLAGATAVEVGAYNLVNPYGSKEIALDLPRVMEKYGINSLQEIIGGAH